MKVDVYRLMERPPAKQQRTLAALRFADLAAFREALAYVCGELARGVPYLSAAKRWSWLGFVQREFARDAAEVPEAAAARFFIWLAQEHRAALRKKRVEAAAKGRRTRRERLGSRAEDWQSGRRRTR